MSGWLRHIVVPIDGSEHALAAVRFAGELADAMDATLSLLHVVHFTASEVLGVRAQEPEELAERLRSGARGIFAAARAELARTHGTHEVREIVEIGDPVDCILAFAERNEADLVVIGGRGLTPLREILLGSVSERVARLAPCPVTIVR